MGDVMSLLELYKDTEKEDSTSTNFKSQISNLDLLTRFICHRIPERTFNIRGHYFPVCARCTGFYIGAFSYFIYVYFFYVQYTFTLIIFAILMMIPTFLDGFTQFFGSRESNNMLRLCTGLLGGVGLAILLKAIKWIIIMG
jgi:uncharacterized membrane protein